MQKNQKLYKWDNISIDEYKQICSVTKDSSLDIIEKTFLIKSFLYDESYTEEDIDEMSTDEITEHIRSIKWIFETPKELVPNNQVRIQSFTIGQYIDLFEHYRNERYEEFLKMFDDSDNIRYFIYYQRIFHEFYDMLKKTYTEIYPKNTSDETSNIDEDIEKETNYKEKQALIQEKRSLEIKARNSWLSMIFSLCEGDLAKYNDIINKPVILCHNWLSMKINKQ